VKCAGTAGKHAVYPGDRISCCSHAQHSNEAEDSDFPVVFLLHPSPAPKLEAWPDFEKVLDQCLTELEDHVQRTLGGAEVVDCAGPDLGGEFCQNLLAWLLRHRLPVAALDFSACDLTDAVIPALTSCMSASPWLHSVGLAENRNITEEGATMLLFAVERRQRHNQRFTCNKRAKST